MGKSPSKKKNKYKLKKWILAVAAAGTLAAGSYVVAKRMVIPGEKVVAIVDGDTFEIANKQRIRLTSLDAPEMGNCFAKEAKSALEKKIAGKKVILKDVITDQFRRITALVYVDGELINEYMIKNGFAVYLLNTPGQHEVLKKANEFARDRKLGIYSPECFQLLPPVPKCTIKGNIIQDSKTKVYLTPDCLYYDNVIVEKYRGETWFCTEAEARTAGFTKSPNCK